MSQILQAGTGGAQTTSYSYDAAGETLTSSDGSGTISYSFDALGRTLTQTQESSGGVTQTSVANSYDNNGNLVQSATSYASGASVVLTLSYDPLDRQVTLRDGDRSYSYDPDSNALSIQTQDPSTGATIVGQTATYDGGSRLTTQTDMVGPTNAQVHSYAYSYNAAGDRASGSADGTLTQYSYDADHQLLSETSGGDTIGYHYDGYNNRDTLTTSAGVTQYSYDSTTHTELTTKTDPDGKTTAYTYDASGNLTQAVYDAGAADQTTTSYTYDGSNRLSGITQPDGTTIAYSYTSSGQRASTTVTPPAAGAAPPPSTTTTSSANWPTRPTAQARCWPATPTTRRARPKACRSAPTPPPRRATTTSTMRVATWST